VAKREWELESLFFTEPGDYGTCLCGHAIREHCVIVNRANGNTAIVGNCCVKRFLGLGSEPVFAGFRRIMRDRGRALTPAAVEYAHARGWLNDWEKDFLLNTRRRTRSNLSDLELAKRREINQRILNRVAGGGRADA
jgi:hypothetical protein